jgi:RHS repeat-associated protein
MATGSLARPLDKHAGIASRYWFALVLLLLAFAQVASAQVTLPLGGRGTMGLGDPNGDFFVAQDDLVVKVPGGFARINRDFDGSQWVFNRQLSGLGNPNYYKSSYPTIGSYFSCTIIDGVNSCDTTATAGTTVVLPPPPPEIHETRIPNDPNFGLDPDGHALPDSSTISLIARKGIVFTRSTDGTSYTSTKFPRFVIRPQQVQVLPPSAGPDAHPAVGKPGQGGLPTAMVNGYRWTDRTGAWIEYDNFGRVSSYGDRNDVRVWMQYSSTHYRLERILDDNGRTVFTLLYAQGGKFVTEARDHTGANGIRRVQYSYDGGGRLTQVIDARGNPTRFDYGTAGSVGAVNSTPSTWFNIKKVTDAEGRITQIGYGATGRMDTLTAPDGGVYNFEYAYDKLKKEFSVTIKHPQTSAGRKIETRHYDAEGRVVYREVNGKVLMTASGDRRTMTFVDERGTSVTVNHDNFDELTSKQFPDGSRITLTYDSGSSNLRQFVDESGATSRMEYDAKGNLLRYTAAADAPEQQVTEYTVNARGEPEQVRYVGGPNPDGSTDADASIGLAFDANGNVQELVDGEGKHWTYEYDTQGNLTQAKDPLEHTWTYTYDGHGNRLSVTDPNEQTTAYSYDKTDRLLTMTDPRGKVARWTYDAAGRTRSLTDSTGASVTQDRDPAGRITRISDVLNHHLKVSYDNSDRMVALEDGAGNVTGLGYNDVDGVDRGTDLTTRIDYPTLQTVLRYNSREAATQALESADGQTRTRSANYDARGLLDSATNAYGKSSTAKHDALGRSTEGTDALGHKVSFSYDHRSNLIGATDELQHTTRFTYDRRNLLVLETNALGQATRYRYDDAGRLQEIIRANDARLAFGYDAGGRLVQRQSFKPGGSLESTDTFHWEAGDRLTSWSNDDMRGVADYDDAGRMRSETVTVDGVTMTRRYTYYANGQVQTYTGPDGVTVTYAYDGNGELDRVDLPGEGSLSVIERKVSAPTKVVLPGGTTQEVERNGRLESTRLRVRTPTQTVAFEQSNTYGQEGELLARTTQGHATNYEYDDALRLLSATGGGPSESFKLDAADNRIQDNVVTSDWQYDAANRLLDRGSVHYDYDAAGNLVTKTDASFSGARQTTKYAYDGYNRLVEVRDGDDALVARYAYDPFGYRVRKEVTATGAAETGAPAGTVYFLQGQEGVLAEVNGNGSVRQSYGWQPGLAYGMAPLFMHVGNAYYYYHVDGQGVPRALTDKSGHVVWEASHITAFGEVTVVAGAAVDQPWRFPGQYYDAETGLHYNVHRYYDAQIGRYITADPLGLLGGFNGYSYANADPVNLIDPFGLKTCECSTATSKLMAVASAVGEFVVGALIGAAVITVAIIAAPAFMACAVVSAIIEAVAIVGAAEAGWSLGEAISGNDVTFNDKTLSYDVTPLCEDERYHRGASGFLGVVTMGMGPRGHCSFDDDTLVQTDHGPVRIADIKVGDKVLARDEKTGEESYQEVLATLVDWHQTTLTLTVEKGGTREAIITTDEHPFFVVGKGFVRAVDVAVGDLVQGVGSAVATVAGSKRNNAGQLAYNLTVANDHTYFVGQAEVLVHNVCPETPVNRAGVEYPQVKHPGTGEPIHYPGDGLQKVPVADRVPWGPQERGAYIKEWYDRGFSTPEGGWSNYDIHHVQPREYGGTNDFDNLVPVERSTHQEEYNPWWREY